MFEKPELVEILLLTCAKAVKRLEFYTTIQFVLLTEVRCLKQFDKVDLRAGDRVWILDKNNRVFRGLSPVSLEGFRGFG